LIYTRAPLTCYQLENYTFILFFSSSFCSFSFFVFFINLQKAGPYGLAGGGSWGAATDEKRIYTNIVNSDAKNFTLAPSNKITTAGGWVAMDANNGRVLWSTANPGNSTAYGPVSIANEVAFAGSADRMGYIYAIDAKSGKILWSYKTGASVYGGMSISNGCIYVGHGYNVAYGYSLNLTSGKFLFAFCV